MGTLLCFLSFTSILTPKSLWEAAHVHKPPAETMLSPCTPDQQQPPLRPRACTDPAPPPHQRQTPTDSENEVVVGLVVDLIQDIKHVDGKVCQRAQMGRDGLLSLGVKKQNSERVEYQGRRQQGPSR